MNTPLILDFLSQLKDNNEKVWMDAHKSLYLQAKEEFIEVVKEILNSISTFDDSVKGLEAKSCIFRINRDIRFSKDKSPYKINFGAILGAKGTHSTRAGYYMHLEPGGKSLLAGGIYMPGTEELKKIRQEIDYNEAAFTKVVTEPDFEKYFKQLGGEKLSRPPQGYSADNAQIEYLKHKSFIVSFNISDQEIKKEGFIQQCTQIFKVMKPLNDFLNGAME